MRNAADAIARDRVGATAVEFAMVAPVLLPMLLGIVDGGVLFTTNATLDYAVSAFATQIRTGQIQAPGTAANTSSGAQMDLSDAKVWICQMMAVTAQSSCTSQLQLDVRPLTSYQSTYTTSPVVGGQFTTTGMCYYSGNGGDMVEIRAYFLYSTIDPLLVGAFATVTSYQGNTGHFMPLTATQVFRAENYSTGSNTGAGC